LSFPTGFGVSGPAEHRHTERVFAGMVSECLCAVGLCILRVENVSRSQRGAQADQRNGCTADLVLLAVVSHISERFSCILGRHICHSDIV
jgi:hypothetical protein